MVNIPFSKIIETPWKEGIVRIEVDKILIFADNVNFEKDETVRNVFRFGIGFEVNAAQLDKLLTKFLAALKKVDDQTEEKNR